MPGLIKQLVKRLPPIRKLIVQRDELLAALKQVQGGSCRPGDFDSPIPSRDEIQAYAAACEGQRDLPLAGIGLREREQLDLFETLLPLCEQLPFANEPTRPLRYHYRNPWFCKHDTTLLAAMLRYLKPRRVIEIGSGFSSAAMLDIDEMFLDKSVRFTFIDPNPRRLDSLLTQRDRQSATIHRTRVQDLDPAIFDELEARDILFVDSSHVARVGSDVNYLIFNVLPRLKAGVYVHFHDIFYPFDYPPEALLSGQYWNEAYLLRAFLQYNDEFQIALFNSWVCAQPRQATPGWLAFEGPSRPSSLWLQRVSA